MHAMRIARISGGVHWIFRITDLVSAAVHISLREGMGMIKGECGVLG